MENNYNVYAVAPKACYRGLSFVAAENADEANKIIAEKMDEDIYNDRDMWGYGKVTEADIVENVHSKLKGISYYGIYYQG